MVSTAGSVNFAPTHSLPQLNAWEAPHPDRELEARLRERLMVLHRPGLRNLSVSVAAGRITIRGHLRSFYEKQLCQQCCKAVAGQSLVHDEVRVVQA